MLAFKTLYMITPAILLYTHLTFWALQKTDNSYTLLISIYQELYQLEFTHIHLWVLLQKIL